MSLSLSVLQDFCSQVQYRSAIYSTGSLITAGFTVP